MSEPGWPSSSSSSTDGGWSVPPVSEDEAPPAPPAPALPPLRRGRRPGTFGSRAARQRSEGTGPSPALHSDISWGLKP
eukprot:8922474-Pyramimonas_sp.AAC.1